MRAILRLVLLGCAVFSFLLLGFAAPADAVAVVKVTANIKVGLVESVPLNSEVVWEVDATVGNHATSEALTKVEWRDTFLAEVTVDALISNSCGTVTMGPGKDSGTTEVRWQIGTMAVGQSCSLHLQVSTADGPPQQFTTSGEHCLNHGATLRFLNALGEQETRTGPNMCVTTV